MQAYLEKIIIENFRNIQTEQITFDPGINCIFGNNGNGKTNILEAIYLLVNRKSFRKNSSYPQFLNYDVDESYFSLQSLFILNSNKQTFSVKHLSPKSVQYSHNGKIENKKPDIKSIFINPFDAYEFFNTPKKRRDWFDEHLSKIDSQYKKTLKRYNLTLKQKNVLIFKKPNSYEKQIKALNHELATNIVLITQMRVKFLEELKKYYSDTFKKIFDETCNLSFVLESSVAKNSIESTLEFLNNNIQKELLIGKSQYGIHKDNYLVFFNGLNAIDYCSIGQQKMSYFSLIFAYIELFRYKSSTFPMILMDDISGELDDDRWDKLITHLYDLNLQVIITTANIKFKEKLLNLSKVKILNVVNGNVENL